MEINGLWQEINCNGGQLEVTDSIAIIQTNQQLKFSRIMGLEEGISLWNDQDRPNDSYVFIQKEESLSIHKRINRVVTVGIETAIFFVKK